MHRQVSPKRVEDAPAFPEDIEADIAPTMIAIEGVSKLFKGDLGEHAALKDVSLTIRRGQIFGIIGRSGAGKSTLVRCVNLLERPTAGRIVVDGQDMTTLSGAELRRARDLLETLYGRIAEDRQWGYQAMESSLGTVFWLEGDFDTAREHLLRAVADIDRPLGRGPAEDGRDLVDRHGSDRRGAQLPGLDRPGARRPGSRRSAYRRSSQAQ